jgi:hypothetical protein
MGKFDALIQKHCKTPLDLRLAQEMVKPYEDHPMGERVVEAMLPDFMIVNDRVGRGEITSAQGMEYLKSLALEGAGLHPEVIDLGMARFAEVQTAFVEQGLIEPGGEETPPAEADDFATINIRDLTAPAPVVDQAQAAARRSRELDAEIALHGANMRAPQGSEQWKDYWQRGGDAKFRAALEEREQLKAEAAEPPASPAPEPAEPPAAVQGA